MQRGDRFSAILKKEGMPKLDWDDRESVKAFNKQLHRILGKAGYLADDFQNSYTMDWVLSRKTVRELREIAAANRIKGAGRMNKCEIIPLLFDALTDEKRLWEYLIQLTRPEWALFKQAAKTKAVIGDTLEDDDYHDMVELGIMSLCTMDGHTYCVIPAEIQREFRELERKGFKGQKFRAQELHYCAVASVRLYGALTLKDFVKIFNYYNRDVTDMAEATRTLRLFQEAQYGYGLWGRYLVTDDFFPDEDYRRVEYVVNCAASKPRYLPSKRKFMLFSDWDYIEPTPQLKALRKCIEKSLSEDPDFTDELIDEIVTLCKYDAEPDSFVGLFEYNALCAETDAEMDEVYARIAALHNHTRLWVNNGHTPAELLKMSAVRLRVLP